MSSIILDGHNLTPYIPAALSPEKKEGVLSVTKIIKDAVMKQVPVGIIYNGAARLVTPHNLFLQNKTPMSSAKINHPAKGWKTKMAVYHGGARQAIGMDAYEVLAKHNGSKGWKTFHMDRINAILSYEDILDEFNLISDIIVTAPPYTTAGGDVLEYTMDLGVPFEVEEDFIGNWNYWSRDFIAQVPSKHDLKPVPKK